jgi:hypothetical protein
MPDIVTDEMFNTTISFQSKNAKDQVVWRGVVLASRIAYDIARGYGDVVSYNGAVQQVDPDTPDVGDLTYFLIKLDNPTNDTMVFANEWISAGSLQALNLRAKVTVVIYDLVENNHTDILTVLKANGYDKVRIESVET